MPKDLLTKKKWESIPKRFDSEDILLCGQQRSPPLRIPPHLEVVGATVVVVVVVSAFGQPVTLLYSTFLNFVWVPLLPSSPPPRSPPHLVVVVLVVVVVVVVLLFPPKSPAMASVIHLYQSHLLVMESLPHPICGSRWTKISDKYCFSRFK